MFRLNNCSCQKKVECGNNAWHYKSCKWLLNTQNVAMFVAHISVSGNTRPQETVSLSLWYYSAYHGQTDLCVNVVGVPWMIDFASLLYTFVIKTLFFEEHCYGFPFCSYTSFQLSFYAVGFWNIHLMSCSRYQCSQLDFALWSPRVFSAEKWEPCNNIRRTKLLTA